MSIICRVTSSFHLTFASFPATIGQIMKGSWSIWNHIKSSRLPGRVLLPKAAYAAIFTQPQQHWSWSMYWSFWKRIFSAFLAGRTPGSTRAVFPGGRFSMHMSITALSPVCSCTVESIISLIICSACFSSEHFWNSRSAHHALQSCTFRPELLQGSPRWFIIYY